jgi:hypothetical protein
VVPCRGPALAARGLRLAARSAGRCRWPCPPAAPRPPGLSPCLSWGGGGLAVFGASERTRPEKHTPGCSHSLQTSDAMEMRPTVGNTALLGLGLLARFADSDVDSQSYSATEPSLLHVCFVATPDCALLESFSLTCLLCGFIRAHPSPDGRHSGC